MGSLDRRVGAASMATRERAAPRSRSNRMKTFLPSRVPALSSRALPVLAVLFAAATLTGCADAEAEAEARQPGSWETLPEGDALMRHESGYVKVGDRLYAVGGRGERAVQAFDPATGSWTTGAVPPLEMHHFQAVEHGGRIYVLGAMTGGYPAEPPIPHVYIYDPATDSWAQGPEIPADRRRGGAGAVAHEGKIYVVAGITNGHSDGHVAWLDEFDPATGEWRQLADAPRPRDHFHAAVLDGKLYAVGGRRSSAATGQTFELTVPEVDVYDFASGAWMTLPPESNLPTERAGSTSIALNGEIVVLGGESASQQPAHAEVEALDPSTGSWRTLAPMNTGRHGTQVVLHDGKLYVVAGSRVRGATEINSQEVFTP